MSKLIVIRIVPQSAVSGDKFTDYLNSALGTLQIKAVDLAFSNVDSNPPGQNIGTAAYIAPTAGWTPEAGHPDRSASPPSYPAGITDGIIQQVDFVPATFVEPAYYQLESVATAVIEVASPTTFENLRLAVQWGSGTGAQPIPITIDYYDVALAPGPVPAPDQWAALPPSPLQPNAYLQLPAPPAAAGALSFALPSDGTPPPFDSLLKAMSSVLNVDPGGVLPDLGNLSLEQCRNIAYEIVWSQQPPLPTPPDAIESLYTNPPNTGVLLSGSTPNQYEGDRKQFEAEIKGYYALADAAADRLTNYVYAVSAAVACEEKSLAATQVALEFPVNPAQPSNAPLSTTQVLLAGFANVDAPTNFGVPAAYFYALGASMPPQITPPKRYQLATGDNLQRVLSELTTAINAGTVTDSEVFATLSPAPPSVNAAQAARRIAAFGISAASTTSLAPLDTVAYLTSADTPSRSPLPFSSTVGVAVGMSASGTNIPANTTVSAVTANSVSLSPALTTVLPGGTSVIFTPGFAADLQQLVKAWLAYPPAVTGSPSSQTYQAGDDATKFWPKAATAHPSAFLNLVLCSLTQGYIIPAPFNVALGDKITEYLATLSSPSTPTVATLASVTAQQWTALFKQHPTWLPAQQGNTAARTAAFIRSVQKFFTVGTGVPASSFDAATSADTPTGLVLPFAPTAGITVGMIGMTVSGTNIPSGATVSAVNSTSTATSVTLSQPVTGDVPSGTNITFTPNIQGGSSSELPLLQAPSNDWLAACLSKLGLSSFKFGDGFTNLANLKAAAADVFLHRDQDAQDWLVDALITIDALYQIMKNVTPAPSSAGFEFSLVEALYARGFRSAADVTELSSSDFQQALTGTVAYDSAGPIFTAAASISPPPKASPAEDGFQPVNPDGSLTNCIPPPCLSPLGPVAYLSEMLQVSESSTCDNPLTPTAPNTLGTILATRRGPLGKLAASCANLETPLPLIDIVNECLEFMGSVSTPTNGAVYDTSADSLANHVLCKEETCPPEDETSRCHDPATIFAALPEHSTPATPTSANSAVAPSVYNKLKVDFSSCRLPYSQALDVSRTYLRHFRTCRFEEMRSFRKCITEFVLDPDNEPVGFQSHLWRYPVRIDTAIEYLGITPAEYKLLFLGTQPRPCAAPEDFARMDAAATAAPAPAASATAAPTGNTPPAALPASAGPTVWQLYGFATPGENDPWTDIVVKLPEFLLRTCLTYCEFLELWKSGFVIFSNGYDEKDGKFPNCEPCCLDRLWLQFPRGHGPQQDLLKLAVFTRLWRKLKEPCCTGYSFDQLRDICNVLHLFNGNQINPDFIRQLATFQMFRDHFRMELVDPADRPAATAIDADRTNLLALWAQPKAAKWSWAVRQLIYQIEEHARRRHHCERRSPEFIELLGSNLDPLSRLAGFDPTSSTDSWHALPTHTLRFAEVLAKICASSFSIGEIFYLFTVGDPLGSECPFPLQENNEALSSPLDLPDDQHKHSLWQLRWKLLEERVADEDVHAWSWKRIEAELQIAFGFADKDVLALGEHFFPRVLEHAGTHVDGKSTRFFSNLPKAKTDPQMWNTPPDGPFQYDPNAEQLWTQVPLTDEAVIGKLTHVHDLVAEEQTAVQDLYFQPRAMLAGFALLFSDFPSAEKHMIEKREESERWAYFRRQFALCHRRCHIIAEHLSGHVAFATGQEYPEGKAPALLILRELLADENKLVASQGNPSPDWENDDGTHPPVTWTPPPNGGGFAALLALAGTGLVAEYKPEGGAVIWRDACGPLSAFGRERDKKNCPVPTVLPSMNAEIPPSQKQFVSVHNGLLMKDATGAWLGGAQGFEVKWSGALLIEHHGTYEFWAGAPTPDAEKPDFESAEHRKWCVTLKRGHRTWILLSHGWPGEEELRFSSVTLKRGAYDLTVEMIQPGPDFLNEEQVCPQHTGFQVKYSGPDSHGQRVQIPHDRLFSIFKNQTLGDGITTLSQGATAFLGQLYIGSLRDIRRTYQRAFKALLFAHRFALSARRRSDRSSELGYMLGQKANFAGIAFYRKGSGFILHAADFDFNYLPLQDDYYPPAQDSRAHPSPQRIQAMFDWWERLFDYAAVRQEVHHHCERHLWHLFDEALEKQPADPAYLLRHMGADSRHWHMDLRYFQGQSAATYAVTSTDLEDDRWVVRAWHADQWLRALQHFFAAKDIAAARPDLWASDNPGARVFGETESGNANLSAFLCDSSFKNGAPRRYEDVKRLNDGLRERGRDALLAYLCNFGRVALPWHPGLYAVVPRDLSDLLLLDVEVGTCEKATRIEDAITAAQSFVRRARLHLELSWTITREFARMWDREFATFHVWQACKRRQLYKENWVEWSELVKARRVEAFRFLESKLQSSELTVAVPGGLEWWPEESLPAHKNLELLQRGEPANIRALPAPHEGLNPLGTPERDARPSWLTAVHASGSQQNNAQAPAPPNPASSNPAPIAAPGLSSSGRATPLPFWMEVAIRMGTRFYRIAAAGAPPAATGFEPHRSNDEKGCVSFCEECRCDHLALVDEYYFWLVDGLYYDNPNPPSSLTSTEPDDYQFGFQDDFYDQGQQQAAYWWDPTQLPRLLDWEPLPMVRLAWCRVHNGEFQQPRRSHRGVPVHAGAVSDLSFVGRTADSLFFSVSNADSPQGYADTSPPGFRYDLANDIAVVLPLVAAPKPNPTFVGKLLSYPYFVYNTPGTHLFPLSPFSPSIAVARSLRLHCRFEGAFKWFRLAFDPLQRDCTWVHCSEDTDSTTPAPQNPPAVGNSPAAPVVGATSAPLAAASTAVDQPPARVMNPDGACCDSADVSCAKAKDRSIILHYLETLREWGDAVMRRGNSPEAFQQARVIFDVAGLILGKRPCSIRLREPATKQTVDGFKPEFAPLNPRLLDLYDVVGERFSLIHACLDARRLHDGRANREMPYFGSNPLREGWRTNVEPCADETEWCHPQSPYRFTFLVQKAQEFASKVQELGGALLAAFEKGDAEYLAALRAGHERELLTLGLDAKKDQWRDADWQIESLQKTKSVSQANLVYYNGLIQNGLISGETGYQDLTIASTVLRGVSNVIEGSGQAANAVGNFFTGVAGFGGTPLIYEQLPIGEPLGNVFAGVARVMNSLADIASSTAGLLLTEAGWQRRSDEWIHQTQILTIEIQQVERQILGAQRRRDQMLQELDSHQRQMEQSAEVQNFLRDKFTAHDLYLFLQRETAALYYRTYDLALYAARQAERAFNFERGHTTRRFLPEGIWDNLHEGLLAGERLTAALRHMEKSYLDENVREYELAKHFSLRLHFPMEFLRLRATGCCEIEIPEWMFDLDFPGHYMRRIRNVTLTIPCVTGPYTGVHCRLTLISSITRIDPRLSAPPHDCCCPPRPHCCEDERPPSGYHLCPDDPRMVKIYGAREAIATSGAQNDSGMFELSFSDPRYLPFEYMGAVSRWRIELPPENNYFDMNTLTDMIVNLNYTAREGGDLLRNTAKEAVRHRLPGDGWSFFDIRHEFPDAWELFRRSCRKDKAPREFVLRLSRKLFPFLPRDPEIRITRLALLFETEEMLDRSCPEIDACPCPERKVRASHIVKFTTHHDDDDANCDERYFTCYAASEWPGLYNGVIDAELHPFRRGGEIRDIMFGFSEQVGEIVGAYLFCRYEAVEECCSMSNPARDRDRDRDRDREARERGRERAEREREREETERSREHEEREQEREEREREARERGRERAEREREEREADRKESGDRDRRGEDREREGREGERDRDRRPK